MSTPARHTIFATAQLRGVFFLGAVLLLLGIGQAFQPVPFSNPEAASLAFQAHTQACKAALLADSPVSGQDIHHSSPDPGDGGLFIVSFPVSSLHSSPLSVQVSATAGFAPSVKRCILFSCLRLGDVPLV